MSGLKDYLLRIDFPPEYRPDAARPTISPPVRASVKKYADPTPRARATTTAYLEGTPTLLATSVTPATIAIVIADSIYLY